MASTFSPSLKLELIGNGDQSGTWGTTTNTNLGTLIEQAITGVQNIYMTSADYVLSNLNGISDEARNAVLVLNGTPAGIRNVIAPAVNKTYIISNKTTGGYAVNIKTSTGLSLAIPNGATQTVYCDGTNFYTAGYAASGGTITGNVAITGTLDVAGAATAPTPIAGSNTANIATTAFVQTALQLLYPIGCIYTTTVATNPNSIFGFGTWVAFGVGQVLIGAGTGWTAGTTGGSADAVVVSHTHTASSTFTGNALAPHSHTVTTYSSLQPQSGNSTPCWYATATGTTGATSGGTPTGTVATTVNAAGVSATKANLQPYIVVYMWNRTA